MTATPTNHLLEIKEIRPKYLDGQFDSRSDQVRRTQTDD